MKIASVRTFVIDCFRTNWVFVKYWYKDYFAYQPDSREKLMTACKMVHEADYQYFFIEDKVDW